MASDACVTCYNYPLCYHQGELVTLACTTVGFLGKWKINDQITTIPLLGNGNSSRILKKQKPDAIEAEIKKVADIS